MATVFISKEGDCALISRSFGDGVNAIGDSFILVGPSGDTDSYMGWNAQDLLKMGEGEHDLQPRPTVS